MSDSERGGSYRLPEPLRFDIDEAESLSRAAALTDEDVSEFARKAVWERIERTLDTDNDQ